MQNVLTVVVGYLGKISLPGLGVIDIIEIGLISFFVYQFMAWIKFTRAYTLLKGILIVLGFILVALIFLILLSEVATDAFGTAFT